MNTYKKPDPARIQALVTARRHAEAREQCSEYVRLAPHDPNAWLLLASLHAQMGELPQVVDCCRMAIKLQPQNEAAHYNLGVALQGLRLYADAESAYRQTIRLNPGNASALTNMAAVLQELGRPGEALEYAQRAVGLNPASPHAHNNLGLSLKHEGRYEDAILSFQQALRINPHMAEALHNLGLVYLILGRVEDAIEHFRQAVSANPQFADAHCDLGVALQAMGNVAEALLSYDRAIELRPDSTDARWNRSLAWLLTGNFEKGWRDYAWRWRRKECALAAIPGPRWDGADIRGKRLYVCAEQGLGDTIQFMRYLPQIKERGAYVIFECQAELFTLLQHGKGWDVLIRRGDMVPPYDMHVHLLDLPEIFHTTLQSIPCRIPYVEPVRRSETDIPLLTLHEENFRVGIVWAGNPGHNNDRNRSCPLSHFTGLTAIPDVRLFSLQKGERSSELRAHGLEQKIVDLGRVIDDFSDTATALERLDLLVTVDTSVAHLAGAMGRPVWLLLPFAPDWRWLQHREDSPWYPTMRLFRQKERGDWAGVFERVCAALATLAKSRQQDTN